MKSRLINNGREFSSVYDSGLQWAFVKKAGEDYELLHDFFSCKDYTHEMIANAVHKERITTNHGVSLFDIDADKLQLAILFKNTIKKPDDFKECLYSAKNFFSDLEVAAKLPKTLIKEVDCGKADHRVFILTMKKHHIESPVLLHSLIALLRTVTAIKKVVTKENILTILENSKIRDWDILVYLIKNNVLATLLNKHKELLSDTDLTEIYPLKEKIQPHTCYHGGFGPVALKSESLCSGIYAKKLYPLIKEFKK